MSHRLFSRFSGLAALALVAALVFQGAMNAEERKRDSREGELKTSHARVIQAPELASVKQGPVVEALKAYEADRKAGRIARGDEERVLRERLRQALRNNRSSEGLAQKKTTTGATALDLEGRFQYVMVQTDGPDGPSVTCVTNETGGAAVSTPGAVRKPAETE